MEIEKKLERATKAMRRGLLTEAERECASILREFPHDYRTLLLLGQILTRSGREPDALAAYDGAARASPGAAYPFTILATKRFRQAFGAPAPPRPTISRPGRRIQMRSLGSDGRFGNQILQYAFVRMYAHSTESSPSFRIGSDAIFLTLTIPFLAKNCRLFLRNMLTSSALCEDKQVRFSPIPTFEGIYAEIPGNGRGSLSFVRSSHRGEK